MSEYLKSNPIALRHCLLYKFLAEKLLKVAFKTFCNRVGSDIITHDKFKYWFDRFAQGRFDDNDEEEPIDAMVTILRNDTHALRACILYEFLQTKQTNWEYEHWEKMMLREDMKHVFDKFKNLCKVIGDDVIKYQEFEFWYYRFTDGLFDLDFEPDPKKKILELRDVPMDIVERIVKKLDYCDRCRVRKVSHNLRDLIDTSKFTMDSLGLVFCYEYTSIDIGYNRIVYTEYGKNLELSVPHINVHGENHSQMAFDDVKILFANPKFKLKTLNIDFYPQVVVLESIFESSNLQVHVKKLQMSTESLNYFKSVLPYLKPGYLETIEIDYEELLLPLNPTDEAPNMAEIVKTEQWKQAKHFRGLGHKALPMTFESLLHFEKFYVRWPEFSSVEMKKVKEILFKSPHFIECLIRFKTNDDGHSMRMADIRKEIGVRPHPNCNSVYFYPIPNSKDHFQIVFVRYGIRIKRIFC